MWQTIHKKALTNEKETNQNKQSQRSDKERREKDADAANEAAKQFLENPKSNEGLVLSILYAKWLCDWVIVKIHKHVQHAD